MRRCFVRPCVVTSLYSLSLTLLMPFQTANGVPSPGEEFAFQFEMVVEGEYEWDDGRTGAFEQKVAANFGAVVLTDGSSETTWAAKYRYDLVSIENRIDGGDWIRLEITPNRMVIDGTPTYDGETNPDAPSPMLNKLVQEEFHATFGKGGRVLQFRERKAMRRDHPFIDLAQPIRHTWVSRPPKTFDEGDSWLEKRTFRILSNLVTLPATQTYTIQKFPEAASEPIILETSQTVECSDVLKVPVFVGENVPFQLRYDPFGPDPTAPPPPIEIHSLSVETTGQVAYRRDWSFIESRETIDHIQVVMGVPQIGGTDLKEKRLNYVRKMTTTVKKLPSTELSEAARFILFGE